MLCRKHHSKNCNICNMRKVYIADDGYASDGQGTKDFFDDEQIRLQKEWDSKIASGQMKVVKVNFAELMAEKKKRLESQTTAKEPSPDEALFSTKDENKTPTFTYFIYGLALVIMAYLLISSNR